MTLFKLRIGSRDSKLAVMQTQLVIRQIRQVYPTTDIELVTLKTTGDKILDRTLDKIGGKGLFVKELDAALMNGEIDIAVHSLKDMPLETSPELPIIALPARGEARDALILPSRANRPPLLQNIGTSSMRRILQLQMLYPHVHTSSVRGNILTRLEKLDSGDYSGLILAGAGLIRAGLSERISRFFQPQEMLPSAGQGILAVQAHRNFSANLLNFLNDAPTVAAAEAERAFVRTLNGGCSSPIAAYAQVHQNEIQLTGLHYNEQTGQHIIRSAVGETQRAAHLGIQLAAACQKEIG